MLVKCPECELQISDKALVCPHCGLPLKADVYTKRQNKRNKRKRLPNGFGQISEMKGHNLRNKFRAMVTVGKRPDGRPIVKPLKPKSHFATYNDAYAALVEYNRNPYELNDAILVKELYEKWSEEYFKTLKSASSCRTITSAWGYCSSVYDMRACDIRARHIKGCMDEGVAIIRGEEKQPTANVKSRIKSLFNLMLDYALEYEIVDRNYARTFNLSEEIEQEMEDNKKSHMIFTEKEMETLWDNINAIPYVDIVLIQCYSGWRPQELGLIKIENVDFEKWIFEGGIKTPAGINRIVPIHPKIRELVRNRYNEAIKLGSTFLLNCTDTCTHRSSLKLTYDKYRYRFENIRDELHLDINHRAHDGRMHFITMAKKYSVDEYAIKYMVGHQIQDITEKVYTQREIEWLSNEIEKIK